VFVCLSVCLSLAAFPQYCTDPHVTWGRVTDVSRTITFPENDLSGKRIVQETSVRESDCPGNVCKALRNGRGYPLVVHYWADLQSVHGFRCCDKIAPNAKCQQVLVLTLCLVAIYYYYCSAQKLILILSSDGGWKAEST